MSDHNCWTDDEMCLECGASTITDAIRWEILESQGQITMQRALERLMRDACAYGRTFYTSDGHPIPLSSYLPRKGDLSDILS